MNLLKKTIWRSSAYLRFVRSLPCCICGTEADVQAHHLIGTGNMHGMGIKAPDWATMPLCPRDHHRMHHEPDLWAEQFAHIARVQGMWIERGMK